MAPQAKIRDFSSKNHSKRSNKYILNLYFLTFRNFFIKNKKFNSKFRPKGQKRQKTATLFFGPGFAGTDFTRFSSVFIGKVHRP